MSKWIEWTKGAPKPADNTVLEWTNACGNSGIATSGELCWEGSGARDRVVSYRILTQPDEWIINEGLCDTCPEELREKLIEVVSLAGSTRTDYGKNFSYWKRSDKHPAHPSAVVKFRIPVVQGVVETKPEVQAHDPVNRPSHYMLFPEHQIEFIDVRDVLIERLNGFTPRQIDYWSRAFEYLARAGGKNGVEDIKKAKWYLDRLVGTLEE